jgi:hypothetical protein
MEPLRTFSNYKKHVERREDLQPQENNLDYQPTIIYELVPHGYKDSPEIFSDP